MSTPLYKSKGSDRRVTGTVYGRIVVDLVETITETFVNEVQGGLKQLRWCLDIFFFHL